MITKNYKYYERGYFDKYDLTYMDVTMFNPGVNVGKSKLSYNKLTGLGVLKLDFYFSKSPEDFTKVGWLSGNSPTANELIEESINIGDISFALFVDRGSRDVMFKHISGNINTVLNRRMIISLVGLWN